MIAFVCGLVFAVGLGLAGMTQPAKVVGFLDVSGAWDPSLLFVMAGAIAVMLPSWRILARRGRGFRGIAAPAFDKTHIDGALVAGAAIFGVGWGLSGYCPGPALVSMSGGGFSPLVFVSSMVAGILAVRLIRKITPTM